MGLVALALRVAYALLDAKPPTFAGDADWYHEMANLLADGKGFVNPFEVDWGGVVRSGADAAPTAFHPPLFPAVLALPSLVGLDSYTAHELFACAMGAATAVVIALVGRQLAGPRVGVVAGRALLADLPRRAPGGRDERFGAPRRRALRPRRAGRAPDDRAVDGAQLDDVRPRGPGHDG